MLQVIEQAGEAGIATNEASLKVFNSRQYGYKILKQGEQLRYITRTKVDRESGGHYYIINKLTPAGRRLLQELNRFDG
jgi:hypothetical protein